MKVHGENLKGWVIEVVGYADSTGNTARNRSLSERRANAVINYLVITYNLAFTSRGPTLRVRFTKSCGG